MAARTFYLLDSLAANSSHLALQDGGSPPATATTTTGWTVGTQAIGQSSSMAAQTERARATFTATQQPSGAPSGVLGDCFRTPERLRGVVTAPITFALPVIAVTSGSDQDGRARLRLWRSRFPDGAAAHEITSGIQLGTGIVNLTTLVQQISTVTLALSPFVLAREFLFFQVAWEIQGAGGAVSRDVLIRIGLDALITLTDLTTLLDYTLYTSDQLDDDENEWLTDYDTQRDSFLSTNTSLLADPSNATLLQAYADNQAAMRTRRIELLRLEAERKRREGESLQDIGTP